MAILYAHTGEGPPESGTWHPLEKHLRAVAELAERFGASFGGGLACRLLGLAHDLGKANPAFQDYLRACADGRPAQSTPHAAAGACVVKDLLGPLALAILGHHAGLPDPGEGKTSLHHAQITAIEAARALWSRLSQGHKCDLSLPEWVLRDPLAAEMFVRMCFSALVDADFLDTEAHFNPLTGSNRGGYQPLTWYRDQLAEHMSVLSLRAPDTPVNRVRRQILTCCETSAAMGPGAFRLTVPTGGGKTLAGLSFALRHAVRHGMERVIFAIPYTSIIDQTADVYTGIFGAENLLEHHSGLEADDPDEGQSSQEYRRRLAAENWDCPLVITTTVQLFESLLSNKPSRCRKLHNIAKSVIILDEVQALPPNVVLPILDVLSELVRHYACTVVFCTATQPDYSLLPDRFGLIRTAREIVDNPTEYFAKLKRVDYECIPHELTHEALARLINGHKQVLCVLNTRRDALQVLQACQPGEELFHLSTLMCPHHRRRCLETICQRLRDKLPVRLVSTQVVEAGVDLDFPLVMRDIGPLDRIVQVAGRCNREGALPQRGRCLLFQLESGCAPQGPYRTGIDLTRQIIELSPDNLDSPEIVAGYFRDLFGHTTVDRVRVNGRDLSVQEMRQALMFATVGKCFRLIPDDTVPIVVRGYESEEVDQALSKARCCVGRGWIRQLAPFMVSVPRRELDRMCRDGLVSTHESGVDVYRGRYDSLFGIGMGTEYDPADLTV